MKRILQYALLALLLPLSACLKESGEDIADGGLRIAPVIPGLETKTVAADASRDENYLGTYLDVFFQGVTDGSFWKEYHLSARTFTDPEGELLTPNWKGDGFVAGNSYDVYVLVNGPVEAHANVGNLAALRNLTHTDATLYQLKFKAGDYEVVEQSNSPYYTATERKTFLMDGKVSWTPTSARNQTINVPLARAAAKFEVGVSFDAGFMISLADQGYTLGAPTFKYDQFAFRTAAVRSGDAPGDLAKSTGSWKFVNLRDEANMVFGITSYSYACSWTENLEAPAILLSVPFKKDDKTTFHYYRVPIRPVGPGTLNRNTLYRVNATIQTKGSYTESSPTQVVNVNYEILDWSELSGDVTEVNAHRLHYLHVTPTEQAIRGDGAQSLTLKYVAPLGANISIGAIPEADLTAAGATQASFATTHTAGSHTYQAFYIDKDGAVADATIDSISLDTSTGTITVTSTALTNRSPKYIRFRVYYEYGQSYELYEDIYLRHFPSDNIQSIEGWFSYKDDGSTVREYSWNPVADGWGDNYDGYEDNVLCPDKATFEYASGPKEQRWATKNATNAWYEEVNLGDYVSQENPGGRAEFREALPSQATRQAANSLANSQRGTGSYSDYYYYGGGSMNLGTQILIWGGQEDWDMRTWIVVGYVYYIYEHYFRVTYYQGYARRYYRDVGTWVRWIPDSETPYDSSLGKVVSDTYNSSTFFTSRVYDYADTKHIFAVSQAASGTSGKNIAVKGDDLSGNGVTNPHMYVIQVSAASDDYVIGRPFKDPSTGFSSDNVVSPAFMVASQLGAVTKLGDVPSVSTTEATFANTHCDQYVETTRLSDGSAWAFSDWRLPTAAELDVIVKYQGGSYSMDQIISGQHYFLLSGSYTNYTMSATDTGCYTRCVRDLTPAELELLNRIK